MPKFIFDKCPICNEKRFSILGKVDMGTVEIEKPKESSVVKCKNCNTMYVNPLPIWSEDDFGVLYKETYFVEGENEIRLNRNDVARRYKIIEKYIDKNNKGTMLEFGAGVYANMVNYLQDKGWKTEIQEPSKSFLEPLKKKFPNTTIITENILDINDKEKYSFIYADSVMEHVHNPIEYAKKCATLLKSGGIFYFISPNEYSLMNYVRSFFRKIRGKPVTYLPAYKTPYHIIGFSRKGIEIMAKEAGFKIVKHIRHYDYLAQSILRKYKNIIFFPIALVALIADQIGLGTNQEIMLIKK